MNSRASDISFSKTVVFKGSCSSVCFGDHIEPGSFPVRISEHRYPASSLCHRSYHRAEKALRSGHAVAVSAPDYFFQARGYRLGLPISLATMKFDIITTLQKNNSIFDPKNLWKFALDDLFFQKLY